MSNRPSPDEGWSWGSNRGLVLVPVALIVMITLADILSPATIHLGPLLVVAPALTASFGGSRLTAAIAALAFAALLIISAVRTTVFDSNHESQLGALLAVSAIVVFFCRLREKHSAELRQVRSVAEAAQEVVLRPLPERIGPLRIAFIYEAAADQARIGGDLYAAVAANGGTRLLIGDVRGKGLHAVDEADLLLGAFRSAAHRELPLSALHAELEATVAWGLAHPHRSGPDIQESFITATLVDVPDTEPHIHVLNSGHPPPLLLHAGRVTELSPLQPAPPLGLGLPHSEAMANSFPFVPGDVLLLYTDGVTEARDRAGRFYPLAERLAAVAGGTARVRRADGGTGQEGAVDPDALVALLRDDLVRHTHGALDDDALLIALRRDLVPGDHPAAAPVTAVPGGRNKVRRGTGAP